jgi:hypothetical protein
VLPELVRVRRSSYGLQRYYERADSVTRRARESKVAHRMRWRRAASPQSNSENIFRFIDSIKVPFALVHLRDPFAFEFLPFALIHPRDVFEYELLFFCPAFFAISFGSKSRLEQGPPDRMWHGLSVECV